MNNKDLEIDELAEKKISFEKWHDDLKNIKISKHDMNKLVMNFFLIEGYKEAAQKFQEETQTEISNFDLNSIQPRINIRQLILNGQIDEAINELNNFNQKILSENKDINFNIKLQKCIELIKKNEIDLAINYAQQELLVLVEENDEKRTQYMDNMEKVMSLLAFENLDESPYKDLINNCQRIKISSEINYEMLKKNSEEKENKLLTLIKLLLWGQQKLNEKYEFPKISNIAKGGFEQNNNDEINIKFEKMEDESL